MSAVRLETVLEGHTAQVRSLAFSPDGATLASAADDGTVRVWDVERGTSQRLLMNHRGRLTLALSRGGRFLACANASVPPSLWDAATGRSLGTLPGPGAGVAELAPLRDREGFGVAMHQRVLIWDAPSGDVTPLAMERFPHDELFYVEALAFSRDGTSLATASTSMSWERGSGTPFESVRLWEMPSGKLRRTLHRTPPMGGLRLSPSGRMLAATGPRESPNELYVWAVASGDSLATLRLIPGGGWFRDIAFSPDERFVVMGVTHSDREEVSLLVMESSAPSNPEEKQVVTLLPLRTPAEQLALSETGTRLATVAGDGDYAVRVWQADY